MAPKSNKGSTLQKKNSHSASKPLEPDKDQEDLYGDDPPPPERTDGYQQAALTKLTTETALVENTRAEGSGKGKEKEGPDSRKEPPTFPEFIRELKDILAECTSQWENFGDHAERGHQIAISCLTWEEVSNKKKPTSGELARDTQAMTQVMTQTTTQTRIQTRITVEEIIATIVTMIAGEEDPQLLLVETREMTRRRSAIADTEGDHKEFTHTEG
ncbi:hypothetical protein PISMIDRAFT_13931 [Pisolithus microcarpus 441]|uniref:Uncharacterized protein n=1 Tax=Pisolithus microcarpus 441 TaxID=765257 RepID=A0A0C9Y321_9AGAM|nr:hypothetical protein PISMIDRAFT_13931 [Pisolithus microcarpus 441]